MYAPHGHIVVEIDDIKELKEYIWMWEILWMIRNIIACPYPKQGNLGGEKSKGR